MPTDVSNDNDIYKAVDYQVSKYTCNYILHYFLVPEITQDSNKREKKSFNKAVYMKFK